MEKQLLYIRPNDILSLCVNLESIVDDGPQYYPEVQEKKNIFGYIKQKYIPAGFGYQRFKTLEEFVSYMNRYHCGMFIVRNKKLIKAANLIIKYRENNNVKTDVYTFTSNDEVMTITKRLEILSGLTCVIEEPKIETLAS